MIYQKSFIIYLTIINLIAFFLCFLDKRKAIRGKFRIPEDVLIFASLIGGCFGMGIAMNVFRHKIKKLKFKLVYLFCIIWLFIFIS